MRVTDVYNIKKEKVKEVELPDEVFGVEVSEPVLHQVVTMQLARRRFGNASTKTRSEVRGGGRKPWRQKGTGRARQGSTRAVQWKGGGRVHTPRPRSYEQAMPKKMRRAALRSALSAKAAEAGIVVVDEIALTEPKTRLMADTLDKLVGQASALVLLPEKDQTYDTVMRSADNLVDAKVLLASYLNIRDLLGYNKVILPLKAVDVLTAHLG